MDYEMLGGEERARYNNNVEEQTLCFFGWVVPSSGFYYSSLHSHTFTYYFLGWHVLCK